MFYRSGPGEAPDPEYLDYELGHETRLRDVSSSTSCRAPDSCDEAEQHQRVTRLDRGASP